MTTAETRQQRRFKARQEKKGAPKPHNHPYRRALEMFKVRADALKGIEQLRPIEMKLALMSVAMKLDYTSRGHGRGTPSRRYGNRPGAYSPHQGIRECTRRSIGGFAAAHRLVGNSREVMAIVYEKGARKGIPRSRGALMQIAAS